MHPPLSVPNKTFASQLTVLVRLASGFDAVHKINGVADMSCQLGTPSDDGREDLTDIRSETCADGNVSSASAYGVPGKKGMSLRCMASLIRIRGTICNGKHKGQFVSRRTHKKKGTVHARETVRSGALSLRGVPPS